MQNYSIKRPLTTKILFGIAAISIALSHFINSLLTNVADITGVSLPTIMAGTIFVLLWWLFNKFLWNKRFFKLLSQTPDLNGEWSCKGLGKKQNDENANFPWNAQINITQNFTEISIHLKTNPTSSQSDSFGATIEKINNDVWKLSYPYKNIPFNSSPDMHAHDGFCQLIFDLKNNTAEGYYFTNNDRKSFGSMKLTKNN